MRHIITPEERGHRAPLSKNEPTEQYSIKVVRSLREMLVALGADKVRMILEEGAPQNKKARVVRAQTEEKKCKKSTL